MKYINEFSEGEQIVGIYLCKSKITAQARNGKDYFNLILADKTGEINGKVWEINAPSIYDFEAGSFVDIHGRISVFNNALQITVDNIRVAPEGTYDLADYVPSSPYQKEDMMAGLLGLIKSVDAPYFKKLLEHFFVNDSEFISLFKDHSAAKSVHHSFSGGLLQHTLFVARLCDSYTKLYKILNRDLLITGALLHDIGKVYEISPFPQNDYTDPGQLLGHIVMGVELISKQIDKISDFPENKALELKHLIISHHGEFEFGSPKKPALVEAIALNFADNTDAKIQAMADIFDNKAAVSVAEGTAWLGYQKIFESNIRPTS